MLVRSCLAVALLTLGCGGANDQTTFEPPAAIAGTGGIVVSGGSGGSAAGMATVEQGGAGSPAAGAGDTGSSAGMGGAPSSSGGQAGATVGGGGAGGAQVAGAGGISQTGGAGASQGGHAGAGGQAGDPLAPQPLPNCPGYVKLFVPQGTCVWLHGTVTMADESCFHNPISGTCATASAPDKSTNVVFSVGALIDRFDLSALDGLCPKQCAN